ncbi:MAG: nitronate monooxygenase [Epibacterium sp.]
MTKGEAFLDRLGISLPLIQAPMAGVSTPRLAAAVTDAGALGSIGVGALDASATRKQKEELQHLTNGPFNVNFFCHQTPQRNPEIEGRWIQRSAPLFARMQAEPPKELSEIYTSFRDTDAFLEAVLDLRPAVVSFHFGLPKPHQISAMKAAGLTLLASATSLEEARQIEAAGLHGIIAQGWEAGGHRGVFEPGALDARLGLLELVAVLAEQTTLPVIAAGGLMTGAEIARALSAGAVAAQLGTAFIGCPESNADAAYRDRLALGDETVMTAAISGRPARCLSNAFTEWASDVPVAEIPAYPCAYDLGKALNAAATAKGVSSFGAQWAGMGADRARFMPAQDLVQTLMAELAAAI